MLREPAKLDEPEIRDGLMRIMRRLFADPGLNPNDNLNLAEGVAGWDSFNQVELFIEAQERFDVELSARAIERIETFGDLVAAFSAAKQL